MIPAITALLAEPETSFATAPRAAPGARTAPSGHAAGARHPPSGVRSPRRPSGRKTRIRIRIANTIDCVQSLPGACQVRVLLNDWIMPMQERAENGARQVADPAEHGGRERDQPELEPLVELDDVK